MTDMHTVHFWNPYSPPCTTTRRRGTDWKRETDMQRDGYTDKRAYRDL